eukprot:6492592-Amphidinium_carterae.2
MSLLLLLAPPPEVQRLQGQLCPEPPAVLNSIINGNHHLAFLSEAMEAHRPNSWTLRHLQVRLPSVQSPLPTQVCTTGAGAAHWTLCGRFHGACASRFNPSHPQDSVPDPLPRSNHSFWAQQQRKKLLSIIQFGDGGLQLRDPAVEAPSAECFRLAHTFQSHQQPEARERSKNLGLPFSLFSCTANSCRGIIHFEVCQRKKRGVNTEEPRQSPPEDS